MSAQLSVSIELVSDHWVIKASLQDGADIPSAIFLYRNLGTTTLGEYYGVCSIDELTKSQEFKGAVIPVFGNKFVRSNVAQLILSPKDDPYIVARALVANVKVFTTAYRASTGTITVYPV